MQKNLNISYWLWFLLFSYKVNLFILIKIIIWYKVLKKNIKKKAIYIFDWEIK